MPCMSTIVTNSAVASNKNAAEFLCLHGIVEHLRQEAISPCHHCQPSHTITNTIILLNAAEKIQTPCMWPSLIVRCLAWLVQPHHLKFLNITYIQLLWASWCSGCLINKIHRMKWVHSSPSNMCPSHDILMHGILRIIGVWYGLHI